MADALSNLFEINWHCPGVARWRLAHWSDSDETVLFDESSGQTHFLAPLATAVLEVLSDQPCSGGSLLDALSSRVEPAELGALRQQLADVVRRLEAAGLVEQWN